MNLKQDDCEKLLKIQENMKITRKVFSCSFKTPSHYENELKDFFNENLLN